MPPTIFELLEALPAHFVGVAPSAPAALLACQAGVDFTAAAQAHTPTGLSGDEDRLERLLVAAAQSVGGLTQAASRALSSGTAPPWLVLQVNAGCDVIYGCSQLAAGAAELSAATAFKIGAACSLVFGPGAVLLEKQLQEAVLGAGAAAPVERLRVGLNAQLGAVVLAHGMYEPLHQLKVHTAFAGSTGKPAALMPWLHKVSRALSAAGATVDPEKRPVDWQIDNAKYVILLASLLTTQPYAKHREWLASDAALQQAVAGVVLECCLPAAAAAVSAEVAAGTSDTSGWRSLQMLGRLPPVLLHPSLAPALLQRLHGPAALAAVQAAVEIVEALPLPRPASMPAAEFCSLQGCGIALLETCLHLVRQADREGGSSAAAAAEPANGGSAAAEEQAPSCNAQEQAAWRLLAIVPRLTSIIQALAEEPDAMEACPGSRNGWGCTLSAACAGLTSALAVLECLWQLPGTPAQAASWAAAVTAGLRLQPLLLRLDASFQQRGAGSADDGTALNDAQRLSWALLHYVGMDVPSLQEQQDAAVADSKAAQCDLAFQLWEAHTAAARLCHFLVSRGSPALAGTPLFTHTDTMLWVSMMHVLTMLHQVSLEVLGDAFGDTALEVAALSLSHAEAVSAVVDAMGTGAAETLEPEQLRFVLLPVLTAACVMAHSASDTWRLLDMAAEAVMARLLQSQNHLKEFAPFLARVAKTASERPRAAVALASGSLLRLLLQAAAELAGTCEAEDQASELLDSWDGAIVALTNAASAAVDSALDTGLPGDLAAQLKQGARSLRQQRRELLRGLAADTSVADRALQFQQLLQPATDLAGLVQQHLALPAVDEERRLAVASSAAARSCAYLRCANLAGQGGPAAREGVGSARCSACRAVWYCGTACSHADWRAGHRRVCKQLAAERQARKQAAAAVAAEQ